MTTGVVKTKKTRLYFATPHGPSSNDADGVLIMYVNCATGIQGLGGPADQIETTCLDSDEKEFEQGMANPAAITIPFNVIPTARAHQALSELKEEGSTIGWMVVMGDAGASGVYPTSVDGSGNLVSAGPTTVRFRGYVADLNIDVQTNEIVRGTLTVQRSGALTWDWPAATQ